MATWTSPSCLLLLATTLGACGTIGLDPKDTGVTGSEDALASYRIDSLDPAWAPLAGGTEVTIRGAGFTAPALFRFGQGEVLNVTVLDDSTAVVTTPRVNVEATVDVFFDSDSGLIELVQAFTFTDEAPTGGEDGGGDGGDGSDGSDGSDGGDGGDGGSGGDASGLVSGRIEFDALAIGCPSCFGYATNTIAITEAVFHEPAAVDWTSWMPAPGTCRNNPVISDPVGSSLNIGSSVSLSYGGSGLTFSRTTRDGLTTYSASGAQFSDYIKNASFDLSVPDGGSLGPHSVPGALRTTSGFTDIQPIGILNDYPYEFPYMSVGSGAGFSWAPTGVSDAVVIDILVFDSWSGSLSGEIFCVANDSGYFVVPPSNFGAFYEYDLAAIYLYRWNVSEAISPVDGSTIQGMTAFGALGSATIVL